MKARDIVIAVIILGIIGFILYNISNTDNTPQLEATPTTDELVQDIEGRFNREIPEDVERVQLEGTVEGVSVSALAIRDYSDGQYTASVLADLEAPEAGKTYHAWINMGDAYVRLGSLQQAKGGWLIDYESTTDYSEYDRVVVSEETTPGTEPQDIVLDGSFE
jgi:hypothetical protein